MRLELLGMLDLAASGEIDIFARFTPKGKGHAAQSSVGHDLLGMRALTSCVESGKFTKLTPVAKGNVAHFRWARMVSQVMTVGKC